MIIIIDNYDSFTYNLYQIVAQHTDTRVFRNDKISIEQIEQLNPDGIILSPGPGRPEDAGICIDIVKHFSHRVPILGICLGHQAIASAFGSDIVQADEIVHGKSSLLHHIGDDIFKSIPTSFYAGRYHSLTVELTSIPAELKVIAICQESSVMAIKHESYAVYGIQFHPESILTPCGETILTNFIRLTADSSSDITNKNKEKDHVEKLYQQSHAA